MAKETNNMALYESLREVPTHATKQFNNGKFSGTDINPMWRIKKLTEVFGPAGKGWYTEVIYRDTKTADNGDVCTFMGINLYVKFPGDTEFSKPIYGEGGNTFATMTKAGKLSVTDEAFKMAYTDALSNATKALGLGADVWFEKDKQHSTKYDLQSERNAEGAAPKQPAAPVQQQAQSKDEQYANAVKYLMQSLSLTEAPKNADEVVALWNGNKDKQSDAQFKSAITIIGSTLKKQAA